MSKSLLMGGVAMIAAVAGSALATTVQVDIRGTVEYNQIKNGRLNKTDVPAGSPVVVSFLLDSTQYMNDPSNLPTRGYFLDQPSFRANFNGVEIGLEQPYMSGTPMFVLRDNDPAVDGFFLSNGTAWDWPVSMDEPGFFGPLGSHFKVTYEGDTLSSLNVEDAAGHYEYDGLTSYYFSVDDGGMDPMWIGFESLDITVIPAPASFGLAGFAGIAALRRRR
ncbi:MAG: hypothetical protein AMXMBFR58_07710 [Phycisphaerae bacterium]